MTIKIYFKKAERLDESKEGDVLLFNLTPKAYKRKMRKLLFEWEHKKTVRVRKNFTISSDIISTIVGQ